MAATKVKACGKKKFTVNARSKLYKVDPTTKRAIFRPKELLVIEKDGRIVRIILHVREEMVRTHGFILYLGCKI